VSIDTCGFGRESDDFCTDESNMETRKIQADIIRRTREKRLGKQVATELHEIQQGDENE
jgi:hypothetical protein